MQMHILVIKIDILHLYLEKFSNSHTIASKTISIVTLFTSAHERPRDVGAISILWARAVETFVNIMVLENKEKIIYFITWITLTMHLFRNYKKWEFQMSYM